jgi:hypothetical protein
MPAIFCCTGVLRHGRPNVSDTRLIGTGTIRNFQWTLEAGDDDEAYGTGLDVTGPDGYRCSGGMGGPKLWGDDLINTYSSRNEEGPMGIAVRASASRHGESPPVLTNAMA